MKPFKEENLRTLADVLKEGMVVLNNEGDIVFWNKGAERMLGYSQKEILGKNAIELMAPSQHKTEYESRFANVRETGISSEVVMEVQGLNKEGAEFPIEITTAPVELNGKPHIVVVIRDVAEKKEAERLLYESQSRYELVENNLTDIIWIMNLDLEITYVSPSVEHQAGYRVEEVVSKPLGNFITPESLELALSRKAEEMNRAMETIANPPILVELIVEQRRKDDTTFWSEVRAGFLRYPDGTPYAILGVSRDITERKLAEEALEESEARYRLLADNLTDVVWTTDMELNWTYISPSVEKQAGFTLEEAQNRNLATIMTPESLERVLKIFQEGFEAEMLSENPPDKTWQADVEVYKKDGGTVWIELRATFQRDADGKPTGILGIARNITEKKEADDKIMRGLMTEKMLSKISNRLIKPPDLDIAINESLEDLGRLMDVGRAYVFEVTDDLQFVNNTHEWVAAGVSTEMSSSQNIPISLLGDWVERLLNNQSVMVNDVATVDNVARDILEAQEVKALIIVPMFGTVRPFGFLGFDVVGKTRVWKEEEDRVLRIASEMLIKAIEKNFIEGVIRENEAQIRSITDATNDGILMTTADGKIVFTNPSLGEMTGHSVEELIGSDIGLLLPEKLRDTHKNDIYQISKERTTLADSGVVESVGMRKDGNTFPIEVSLSTVQIRGITNVLATVRDITERKRIVEKEKETAAAVASAKVSEKHTAELRDIITVSAHELRHPATVFKGYSQMLLENWDELDEEDARSALEAIDKAADRLSTLADTLMETSHTENMELSCYEVSPSSLILWAVKTIGPERSVNKLDVRPFDTGYNINVDPEKVSKVLEILIDNALKYSPGESLVDIWYEQEADETVYCVMDRGPGIPEKDREKVFNQFYQVEDVHHHSLPGMGLGLYIAKSLVEAHGGWIKVEPGEGNGALFCFGLPHGKEKD